MIHIPNSVFVQYEVALKKREIPSSLYFYSTQRQSQYSVAGYEEKSALPEWDALLAALAGR